MLLKEWNMIPICFAQKCLKFLLSSKVDKSWMRNGSLWKGGREGEEESKGLPAPIFVDPSSDIRKWQNLVRYALRSTSLLSFIRVHTGLKIAEAPVQNGLWNNKGVCYHVSQEAQSKRVPETFHSATQWNHPGPSPFPSVCTLHVPPCPQVYYLQRNTYSLSAINKDWRRKDLYSEKGI